MPEFSYEALTSTGEVARGAMPAESEMELESRLRDSGQYLIRAEPRDVSAAEKEPVRRTDGKIARKELLAFTEYLWVSAQVGVPLMSTLHDVEGRLESKRMRRIVAELRESMQVRGEGLSAAMSEHPKVFSPLYVGAIEAGESTGQMDFALGQLVEYLEWQQGIATQVRQATLYPAMVVGGVVILVIFLITFVYARLMPVFTGFDIDLPLPTRIVVATSTFLGAYWYLLLLATAALVGGFVVARATPRGRRALDTAKLRMPVFGNLLHQIEMARFVTYMALFHRTGIALIQGLRLLERMTPNVVIADGVREAREAIVEGTPVAQALTDTGLFPVMVQRSFALGETTGRLDEALARAKTYYDREVPAAVQRMLTALHPLLIVLIGGLLMLIALSIFLPIIGIYQSIG